MIVFHQPSSRLILSRELLSGPTQTLFARIVLLTIPDFNITATITQHKGHQSITIFIRNQLNGSNQTILE